MPEVALITGAYGFVGRHVARHMADEGWVVRGLGHGSWTREEWRAWGLSDWRQADVTLESLVTYGGEPAVIVHCAGGASVGFSVTYPHRDFARTVSSTADVLEYVRLHARAARVVLASSAGVYGEAATGPISEDAPCVPVSPYGTHKKVAEDLCRSYGRSCDVAAVCVRLFSVYGAGLRKQLLWDACNKLSRGERHFYGTGAELRDWVHVTDAATMLVAAIDQASTQCPVVNGGTGRAESTRRILTALFDALGSSVAPTFTGEPKAGDPVSLVADPARAFMLHWKPRVSWEQGIAEYATWFRSGAP